MQANARKREIVMLYSEKVKLFTATHPCDTLTVDGARYRYILYGKDKDFTQEKDVHISGLSADLMYQKPVTEADFAALEGKILLILPDQDFFSVKMQENLVKLMHNPQISYVSGGHLSTVVKADGYIRTIRNFLNSTEI